MMVYLNNPNSVTYKEFYRIAENELKNPESSGLVSKCLFRFAKFNEDSPVYTQNIFLELSENSNLPIARIMRKISSLYQSKLNSLSLRQWQRA